MTFEIYTKHEGAYYLVDQAKRAKLFTATRRGLAKASVTALGIHTYELAEYVFAITVSALIPKGG